MGSSREGGKGAAGSAVWVFGDGVGEEAGFALGGEDEAEEAGNGDRVAGDVGRFELVPGVAGDVGGGGEGGAAFFVGAVDAFFLPKGTETIEVAIDGAAVDAEPAGALGDCESAGVVGGGPGACAGGSLGYVANWCWTGCRRGWGRRRLAWWTVRAGREKKRDLGLAPGGGWSWVLCSCRVVAGLLHALCARQGNRVPRM